MAVDPWILKEDGYLNVDVGLRRIVYHPTLNVVLLCTEEGSIRVLDVNSGVVLHTTTLTAQDPARVQCKYIFGQDRVVFSDGLSLGARSDYNGVLLLDTILQKPVSSPREVVQIELLLSEAQILKQSLIFATVPSLDYVVNELTEKIIDASKFSKKGIKAQKWNTVCLSMPLEYLRTATDSTITEMLLKNQHTPELSVAAAVQERLSELVGESSSASDRRAMASEAKRRETFTHWPHMDYKWALPDQMAQAGFYHQPNHSGDDRAMCFTCTVCLVCWERTDEPWSEHERHSPTCPFVLGEYTHNVPLAATLATTPAADATYRGVAINVLGSSSVPSLIPTSNRDGLVSVFDISGKVTRTHLFFVTHFDTHVLDKVTHDFGGPGLWSESSEVLPPVQKNITALALVGQKTPQKPTNPPAIRPAIIVSLTLKFKRKPTVESLNQQNADLQADVDMEAPSGDPQGIYLVVYDFTYTKTPTTSKTDREKPSDLKIKTFNIQELINLDSNTNFNVFNSNSAFENQTNDTENQEITPIEVSFCSTPLQEFENFLYQSFVPGESDKICLPTQNSRQIPMDVDSSETDSMSLTEFILNQPKMQQCDSKKSISDHISELKNSRGSKRLNYSRAVQCISIPLKYKNAKYIEVMDIIPSVDGLHVLVVLKSNLETERSVLIVYALDFDGPVVKLNEQPVCLRELELFEGPKEVSLLVSQLERPLEGSKSSGDCTLIMVCVDGAVRILDFLSLKTLSVAELENERFVSAAYCNSLERLCASTDKGSLHFYTLNDADNESTEDHEEDDLFSLNMEFTTNTQTMDSWDSNDTSRCFQDPPAILCDTELQKLQPLLQFEPSKPGYCAVVPPCWSEMQQLQRQRRVPQLNSDCEPHTKTWRLQTDTTTWDEHIFELTLPTPATIGHIDVHFTLHPSTNHPHVELTLLRQNTNSIGHKKFQVDDHIILDAFTAHTTNPVTTNEYLRAHNADILAGPIDIRSGLDLTDLSGIVTLTSPKLFKSRNRTFLLHFKSVQSENGKNIIRKTEYIGCDCIHEVSITIYVSKHTDVPHERSQRLAMLESNNFAQSLCLTAKNDEILKENNLNQANYNLKIPLNETSKQNNEFGGFSGNLAGNSGIHDDFNYSTSNNKNVVSLNLDSDQNEILLANESKRLNLSDNSSDTFVDCPSSSNIVNLTDDLNESGNVYTTNYSFSSKNWPSGVMYNDGASFNENVYKNDFFGEITIHSDFDGNQFEETNNIVFDTATKSNIRASVNDVKPTLNEVKANVNEIRPNVSEARSNINEIRANTNERLNINETKPNISGMRACMNEANHSKMRTNINETLNLNERSNLVESDMRINLNETANSSGIKSNLFEKTSVNEPKYVNATKSNMNDISNLNESRLNMNEIKANINEIKPSMNEFRSNINEARQNFNERPNINEIKPNVSDLRHNANEISSNVNEIRSNMNEIRLSKGESMENDEDIYCDKENNFSSGENIKIDNLNKQFRSNKKNKNSKIYLRNMSLDTLNFLAAIRLNRLRNSKGEAPIYQTEFIKIIENNLKELILVCLIRSSRSTGFKLMKLIVTCLNGAQNISSDCFVAFSTSLFNAIICGINVIFDIRSPANLNNIVVLLSYISRNINATKLGQTCIGLLTKISEELTKRSNPYHLILRSRFGLFGTPFEPELFDIETCYPQKNVPNSLAFCNVMESGSNSFLGENSREFLDAKEVFSGFSVDGKSTGKTMGHRKFVHGLLETEPLHFICISASDGTRVEKADLGTNGNISGNLMPITVTHMNGGTKKVEEEQWDHFVVDEEVYIANNDDIISFCNLHSDKTNHALPDENVALTVNLHANNGESSSTKQMKRAEDIINPNKSLPWQQLLVAPTLQVIVVERMHSGARRFVTLDFGQPVLLTDILIPSCSDLVSISVDLWLKGEDVDGLRLVTSPDIGTKNLIMTDLQPPPLCRYMKIITVGRYGMSNTRCRIPLGQFYGHLIVLPEEIPTEHQQNVPIPTSTDLQTQLNILNMLFEDVTCRYSLACSKLKELLQPLVVSDISNGGHLSAFMESTKEKTNNDNNKIFGAYQEAITYQRQLNTVKNVILRIENNINSDNNKDDTVKTETRDDNVTIIKVQNENKPKFSKNEHETILTASTDKLRSISEALLEILITTDSKVVLSKEVCVCIFNGFCVAEKSRLQFLSAMMLDKFAKKTDFWGGFLNGTLQKMFASSYNSIFPQDRVFVLLAFLVRRASNKSLMLDATLKVVADVLEPVLERQRGTLLAVAVDLPLLGWALLLLALQLDVSKNYNDSSSSIRWDWMTGEMAARCSADSVAGNYKKKLQKRNLQYKQQLDNLEITHKVVQSSAQVQALSALSNHAAHLTHKLEAALKQQENFLKKMKQFKSKETKTGENVAKAASQGKPRRKNLDEITVEKEPPPVFIAKVDSGHCLVVIRRLFALLLNIDHSCSADMFLLACKVIARLVRLSGRLTLRHLLTHNELLKLVNLCLKSELPWAPHALACLLQDILNILRSTQEHTADSTNSPSTWGSTQDFLVDVDKFYKTLTNEESILTQNPYVEQIIIQPNPSTSAPGTLPSLYESDDSDLEDMLDDILERGRTLLKKPIKKSLASAYSLSSAVDSRLELGVEWQTEVALRRLITLNSHNLNQNLVLNNNNLENEDEIQFENWSEVEPIEVYPSKLSIEMLDFVFENLFAEAPTLSANCLGNVLELWLTLNVGSHNASIEDKFKPGLLPKITLSAKSIRQIVTAIAWNPLLPLKTWVCALQTLTLICNQSMNGTCWSDDYGLYSCTANLVEHNDFQQLLLALLSGTGIVNLDKSLAGPSLCKALHDLLVRLQLRCDVVSSHSTPGNNLKSLLLRVLYQLEQPTGPLASRTGPLDVQCKFLQSMLHLDYANADLSIVISILESAGLLVNAYVNQADRIKCMNIGERLNTNAQSFSGIFASVLGTDPNKQDRPVTWEFLLVALLKLLGKLVQTPLVQPENEPMEVEIAGSSSQTDESKAEQINTITNNVTRTQCLADSILQHRPCIIQLCLALSKCKDSSVSMLANISQNTFADLGEPTTVADGIFYLLGSLAKKCSRHEYILEPIVAFLNGNNALSEPLLWFILQVIHDEESLKVFIEFGGIEVLCKNLVVSSDSPETLCSFGAVSMVMQHFLGTPQRSDAGTVITTSTSLKKMQQASLENSLCLVNFAPYGKIRCMSGTAQAADVLIQAGAASHRRARTPQWSYHFYPEEAHTELTIQLPSAILLREVHLQPHLSTLATCPSAVALETSPDGPARLTPACPPLPTSGMTFIRMHLPIPEVVNCVQLRLYKPRDASNIGLSQIRLLGTSAFGGATRHQPDLNEDESHCKHSLGWLRLLHYCLTLPRDENLKLRIINAASINPDTLQALTGLLLVPSHVPSPYLPNLEKIITELSLANFETSLQVIGYILSTKMHLNDTLNSSNIPSGRFLTTNSAAQSTCEVLQQICTFENEDTSKRIEFLLKWTKKIAMEAVENNHIDSVNSLYISTISSIIWTTFEAGKTNVKVMVTDDLFLAVFELSKHCKSQSHLKFALDSLLCAICYVRNEFFAKLLEKLDVLQEITIVDNNCSVSDDRKDSSGLTDDTKRIYSENSEWYERLTIRSLNELDLDAKKLETLALCSRSSTSIRQLLDSQLPKLLNMAIVEFTKLKSENIPKSSSSFHMGTLKRITAILRFFCEVSEEKLMRDYLGSKEGSVFLLPLLNFLCAPRKPTNLTKNYLNGYDEKQQGFNLNQDAFNANDSLRSESYTFLEEATVKLLSKMCLCHPNNQLLLSKVLCEVIAKQKNGISGFLRRLILQLLLENEKVPVSVEAEEPIYKNPSYLHPYLLLHPAFKHSHNRALLYLGTNVTLGEILEKYVSFSTNLKAEPSAVKKELSAKAEGILSFFSMTVDSDLSMAAGVTAKDKRIKCSTPLDKFKSFSEGSTGFDVSEGRIIQCSNLPDGNLNLNITLGQLLRQIEEKGAPPDWPCIHLNISQSKTKPEETTKDRLSLLTQNEPNPPLESALQVFSSLGGLALLAQHLPTVYPDTVRSQNADKTTPEQCESDWVKVDASSDDIYEDVDEGISNQPNKNNGGNTNVPPHSLTAFGLFLRLPGYAEVLLKDSKKALCLLRLVLGVTDDGEGGNIFQTNVAETLPTLPFEMLKKLYDSTPLSTDDGRLLRRISIHIGVVHLLLGCLAVFTHQIQVSNNKESKNRDDRGQLYWAKGTGFGTGSTQQSWNVEQALLKQKSEEEHVTVLLQVLASYINPNSTNSDALQGNVLPTNFTSLLLKSALLPALSSYLRNDSVLDMARHIPLYKAALKLLRAIAASSQLVTLLLPQKNSQTPSIASLLKTMKSCMDTYASKLRVAQTNKTGQKKGNNSKPFNTKMKLKADQLEELDRDEGLALLMPDIQLTATMVCAATERLKGSDLDNTKEFGFEHSLAISHEEERYLKIMKKLQFDTFEMIQELPEGGYKFVISHHFESNAREAGDQSHPARVKRLAQETVTLATSLPLSYSSSVFVRCDTDRLDIMKVLITGPADTPYANGCFELDVFFPPNYPLAPMMINLETTGHHTVRFNPNLYNDGKVCLSVLNTWHGRPEEKWNAQTSSFLQVLVSIQSLILVPEPYFNEPGYERSRGTPTGTQSSKDYNANICLATVRWAMLEQIVNPCPCFKEVIHAHFYLKRQEIMDQVEKWIKDLENEQSEKRSIKSGKRSTFSSIETFREVYQQLKEKLMKLQPPPGAEEEPIQGPSTVNGQNEALGIESDVEMQKMVSDMLE